MALPPEPAQAGPAPRQRSPDEALLAATVNFARALRGYGLSASVDSELVFLRALSEVDVRQREEFYWAAAFHTLGHDRMDAATADRTLGTLLKERDDLERIRGKGLDGLVEQAEERAAKLQGDGGVRRDDGGIPPGGAAA